MCPEGIRFPLDRVIDINLQNTYGRTARKWAAGQRSQEGLAILGSQVCQLALF